MPTAITLSGKLFETTELEPTIVPFPMVTPGRTVTNSPSQTLSLIITSLANNGLSLGGISGLLSFSSPE